MSDTFSFAMGDFEASFPRDYQYAKNHMWALAMDAPDSHSNETPPANENPQANGAKTKFRFGLTAYAVRLLQDVYFLDWTIEAPSAVKARDEIGSIESKKAESDLFSPLGGVLTAFNDAALDDPALINADPYVTGWLLEIECEFGESQVLLSADQYAEHLDKAWDVAQRTIKGQANQ